MIPTAVHLHNVAQQQPGTDRTSCRVARVPAALLPTLNAAAQVRAYYPAGCELRFNLAGAAVQLALRFNENRLPAAQKFPVLAEVRLGDHLAATVSLNESWTGLTVERASIPSVEFSRHPRFSADLCRVLLPGNAEAEVRWIAGEISAPIRPQLPARTYLAYGSSITHGMYALAPSDTYPSRVAQRLGLDGLNLGFGSGAKLEIAMAEWIVGRTDWHIGSLELGINLMAELSVAEFAVRVGKFLAVFENDPGARPLFCIDLLPSRLDVADGKANQFRQVVREAVKAMQRPDVFHVDGLKLLTSPAGLTADMLHPSSAGCEEIAAALAAIMRGSLPDFFA